MTLDRECPDRLTIEQMRIDQAPLPEPFLKHLETCTRCAETMTDLRQDDTWADQVRLGAKAYRTTDNKAHDQLINDILTLSLPSAHGSDEFDLQSVMTPPLEGGELGRMGDYRVLEMVGQGGMGMVFLAEDPRLMRRVALKVMRPEKAKLRGMKERFLREARAVAALECEYIVPIFEVNEANRVPFIVMPFLKGELLADRLRTFPQGLPIAETLSISRQVASGLAVAHAKGLIHRDIKPSNVWLDQQGTNRIKILDFGLARGPDETVLTQVGDLIGTPSFMAPEQARGELVDHRADLFSLGVMLYVMSTGTMPFRGNSTVAILTSLAVDTPEPVLTLNSDIPPRLATLIDRLLSKDRDQRPATTDEVVRELAALESPGSHGTNRPTASNETSDAVEASTLTAETRPRGEASSGVRRLIIVATMVFVAACCFAASQFVFQTKDGKLIVEVDDSVDLRVKQGRLEVYDEAGQRKYSLELSPNASAIAPGKYLVKVVGTDGVKLETADFEMAKAGRVVLRVTAAPAAPAAPKPPSADVILDSTITAENLPFGKADAFPGKVTFRDTFESSAKSLLPLVDRPPLKREVREGKYQVTHTEPKVEDYLNAIVGPAVVEGAFAARVRVENGVPYVNVRGRVTGEKSRFLSLNVSPAGMWSVYLRRQDRVMDSWVHRRPTLLHASKIVDPNLVGGKWITIASRWSETDYAFWINDRLVASGTIDPNDLIGGRPNPVQIGLQVQQKNPSRLELDFATKWDQTDVPRDQREPRRPIP